MPWGWLEGKEATERGWNEEYLKTQKECLIPKPKTKSVSKKKSSLTVATRLKRKNSSSR